MKLKRLNDPSILKRIGRGVLSRFLERFRAELGAQGLCVPGADVPEADYFSRVAWLLLAPDRLPDGLNEALFAIEAMSSRQGYRQLEACAEWADLQSRFAADSSREDIAVQLWLAAPKLLARVHNAQRLRRLTTFEYAGTKTPPRERPPFRAPDAALLEQLSGALDGWFAGHQRGRRTARVEVFPMEAEYWFMIRHGDLFARRAKVEEQRTEILHFRPERDDVVIYSPLYDELRINARTQAERNLYLDTFGLYLRGRTDYFSQREPLSLEPLRIRGADALDVHEIDGINQVVLIELESVAADEQSQLVIRAEQGIFEIASSRSEQPEPIPEQGELVRAVFKIYFCGSGRARLVEVRPPDIVKVSHRCDTAAVQHWLAQSGIKTGTVPGLPGWL